MSFNQNQARYEPHSIIPRTPACGGKKDGAYDLSLHVIALFIILIQSILSCSFPLIVKQFPQLKVPHLFLFLSRHFGTGVLIATAFVHLLPTAFTSLTDPCLPSFWNKGYPAMTGLISMVAVFFVVVIEMIFSTMNGGSIGGCHGDPGGMYGNLAPGSPALGHGPRSSTSSVSSLVFQAQEDGGMAANGILRSTHRRRSASIGHQLRKIDNEDGFEVAGSPSSDRANEEPKRNNEDSAHSDDEDMELRNLNGRKRSLNQARMQMAAGGSMRLSDEQLQQKNLLQVMLLEAGILFHSVFIGMALSVATGSNFIVLLIAITFHQTFEGLALGSRIAGISAFHMNSPKPWLMCLAYGTTTPIGQVIGLLTRNLYDPASQTGLLMVGIMNAISSGLLLFAGLVELLAEDFLSDESYVVLSGKRRLHACFAVAAGAACMALVGAWA